LTGIIPFCRTPRVLHLIDGKGGIRGLEAIPDGVPATVGLSNRQAIYARKFLDQKGLAQLLKALGSKVLKLVVHNYPTHV
jgi:hypothetical protein